jgi:diguanylate cyclase (GGDEF)-like protein/PAS domain S-box-containing protein
VGANVIPHPIKSLNRERLAIAKTFAATVTGQLGGGNRRRLQQSIESTVRLNDQVMSIGIYRNERYIFSTENHETNWLSDHFTFNDRKSLDLSASGKKWGQLQIQFASTKHGTHFTNMVPFPYPLIAFIFSSCTIISWWILGRSFRYLSPTKVVPKRVRSAFDSLAEGLVLVSETGEIAHTNVAFEEIIGKNLENTLGKTLDEFGWSYDSENQGELPWSRCLKNPEAIAGEILQLESKNEVRKFFVNVSPIHNDNGKCRGAMVSFDDVTELEKQRSELAQSNISLRQSRDEIERQNEQLTFLACYDTLTQCMNRRAFWQEYENMWKESSLDDLNLLMVDIDHFKSINDTYGHSFGDEVLRHVGETLRNVIGEKGLVCRYGGEEFVIAIPNMKVDPAHAVAVEVLEAIRDLNIDDKKITTSVGLSNREFKPMDCQHLLDQADESLYAAKHGGRNRVIRFDECDSSVLLQEQEAIKKKEASRTDIPYSTVSRLMSTLGTRCPDTARHSMRVADLAVELGKSLLHSGDVRRLEIAALLHDINKLGMPESILQKPGKLTKQEIDILRKRDHIGADIIATAFKCDDISEIVKLHRQTMHARAAGEPRNEALNSAIQISADIITVCDAFDSMIHHQVWRSAMSIQNALQEILDNTPDQFEPNVVSELIGSIQKMGIGSAGQRKPESRLQPTDSADESMSNLSSLVMVDQQLDQVNVAPPVQ